MPPSEPLDFGGYQTNPSPVIRNNPWNIHHVCVDLMPPLHSNERAKLGWIISHTELQLSSQEQSLVLDRSAFKDPSAVAWASARSTLATIIEKSSGADGSKVRVFSLCESENGEFYALFFVSNLRLDVASNTVICDAAIVHSSSKLPHSIPSRLLVDLDLRPLQLVTTRDEAGVWEKLIPAFVERCRTWSHAPSCQSRTSTVLPPTVEPNVSPVCTCGQGLGFDAPEWKVNSWADILPFATRLAISPLFHAGPPSTSKKSISGRVGDIGPRWEFKPRTNDACWACYEPGKPHLLACSMCKKARYCSGACQKRDWKRHKVDCTK